MMNSLLFEVEIEDIIDEIEHVETSKSVGKLNYLYLLSQTILSYGSFRLSGHDGLRRLIN